MNGKLAFVLVLMGVLLFGCTQTPGTPREKPPTTSSLPPAPSEPTTPNNQTATGPDTNQTTPNAPVVPAPPPTNQTTTPPTAPTNTTTPSTITPPIQPQEPTAPRLNFSEMTFDSDGWRIHGSVYPPQSRDPTKVLILAHMFSHDRSDYPESVISYWHEVMPNTMILNLDLRGHGKSMNIGNASDFNREDFYNMKDDIMDAKRYVKERYPTLREFYVVGASIGSTAAINAAAQDSDFTRVVLLAPGMDYQEVNINQSIRAYSKRLLLVASNEDGYSKSSITQLAQMAGGYTETKIYPIGHGTEIFGNEGNNDRLKFVIVTFLNRQ